MKGRITLQPLREEKKAQKGHPVFEKETACFGYIDHVEGDDVHLDDGDIINLNDTYEFMVRLENGDVLELNHDNIDEAMDNDWWDYYSGIFGGKKDGKELVFKINKKIATVIIEPIELGKTERGFSNGKFADQYGAKCSIQSSSLATKACIWLGVDDVDPKIMSRDAIKLGLREQTNDERDNGWVPFEIPEEVLLSSRMHLSREDVKKLLPLLQRFAETGSLYE